MKIYLATRYTAVGLVGNTAAILEQKRYERITKLAARLIVEKGHIVYSPVTSCHPLLKAYKQVSRKLDWAFWVDYNLQFANWAEALVIYEPHGYQNEGFSAGVKAEYNLFHSQGKPLFMLEARTCDLVPFFTSASVPLVNEEEGFSCDW